jgi:hypothetical protein
VGYNLANSAVKFESMDAFRFRNEEYQFFEERAESCSISAVYFPLLAALIPKWLKNIEESRDGYQKVIVLVTGRGTPVSETAKISDNSTQYTAKLMQLFINRCYPEIKVQLLHSKTNLFRYDENIGFVKRELLPAIDEYRDLLVDKVGGKWKDRITVTLSFADGASARTNAINASLRYYRCESTGISLPATASFDYALFFELFTL